MSSPPSLLGLHWIADALECDQAAITGQDAVRTILHDLPARLGLTPVSPVQLYEHRVGRDATHAGIVLIAESHLSAHAFPAQRWLHVDLFSCKAFDVPLARAMVKSITGATRVEEQLVERRQPRDD